MPSRWPIPSENAPARFGHIVEADHVDDLVDPAGAIPAVAAIASRWLRAERPVWTARASSSAPTSCSGRACSAYGLPLTVTVPPSARPSPRIIRIVVTFPAPLGPGSR